MINTKQEFLLALKKCSGNDLSFMHKMLEVIRDRPRTINSDIIFDIISVFDDKLQQYDKEKKIAISSSKICLELHKINLMESSRYFYTRVINELNLATNREVAIEAISHSSFYFLGLPEKKGLGKDMWLLLLANVFRSPSKDNELVSKPFFLFLWAAKHPKVTNMLLGLIPALYLTLSICSCLTLSNPLLFFTGYALALSLIYCCFNDRSIGNSASALGLYLLNSVNLTSLLYGALEFSMTSSIVASITITIGIPILVILMVVAANYFFHKPEVLRSDLPKNQVEEPGLSDQKDSSLSVTAVKASFFGKPDNEATDSGNLRPYSEIPDEHKTSCPVI